MLNRTSKLFTNIFILFLFFLWTGQAHAGRDEYCRVQTHQLEDLANKVLDRALEKKQNFPMSSLVQSTLSGEILSSTKQAQVSGTIEGFFRISKSGRFSVLPLSMPLFTVDLTPERDIVYICAHMDPDDSKYFFELYFLTGYGLGEISMRSFLGDVLMSSVSVAPVVINPVSFNAGATFFGSESETGMLKVLMTPFRIPMELASQAQDLLFSTLGLVFPVGVERVVMTRDEVVLSSDVDLKNPSSTSIDYRISLK